jgi:hypothetical protein
LRASIDRVAHLLSGFGRAASAVAATRSGDVSFSFIGVTVCIGSAVGSSAASSAAAAAGSSSSSAATTLRAALRRFRNVSFFGFGGSSDAAAAVAAAAAEGARARAELERKLAAALALAEQRAAELRRTHATAARSS